MSLCESKEFHYIWRDCKLWILVEFQVELKVESHNTHTHTHIPVLHCASTAWRSSQTSALTQLKITFFFKGFEKWNAGPGPQQVNCRSAQETAFGSGVKWKCLEVHHKAFQQHSLPVQEKCKLQLSRSSQILCSALWHPVAPVKGNSTQSLPDVICAPISAGATDTKDLTLTSLRGILKIKLVRF